MTEKGMTLTEKYLDCREALNSVTKQLELYKKAFELLAEDFRDDEYQLNEGGWEFRNRTSTEWMEIYLEMARTEE